MRALPVDLEAETFHPLFLDIHPLRALDEDDDFDEDDWDDDDDWDEEDEDEWEEDEDDDDDDWDEWEDDDDDEVSMGRPSRWN